MKQFIFIISIAFASSQSSLITKKYKDEIKQLSEQDIVKKAFDYINLSKWILELKSDNKILGEYKKNSKAFFLENANRLVILDKYISLIEN